MIPNGIPQDVISAAQEAMKKWHVPASVTIAQWALESAYGRMVPYKSNNPFGIKAGPHDNKVLERTHEFYHGRYVVIDAWFRKFATLADAFDKHGELIATGPAYRRVMEYKDNAWVFAEKLTGVYATDPHYGVKLHAIMTAHKLEDYDK